MFIYKIVNTINNKVYVGQTTKTIVYRWMQHLKSERNTKHCKSPIYLAMRKHGVKNFSIHPIMHGAKDLDELNRQEILVIRLYNAVNKGYNCQHGGTNAWITEEARKNISDSVKKSPTRYWLGKTLSQETRDKISNTKIQLGQALGSNNPMFGKKHKQASVEQNAISNGSKPFNVYKDGTLIGSYVNKTQCAKDIGSCREAVRDTLSGRFKSTKGHTLEYIEDLPSE